MSETKVFTMRLDPKLVGRIDDLNARRHAALFTPGTGVARPPMLSRAEMIRWLLEVGLAQVEKSLSKKGGQR